MAAAAGVVLVLLLGARAALASERWLVKVVAWLALLAPPAVGLLIGFGCNLLWW